MSIIRIDPAFDALVPRDAHIEKVAGGFTFTEGPLWRPSGALWFSDVVGNVVRQWSPDGTVKRIAAARRLRRQQPAGRRLHRTQRHDDRRRTATVLLCQHGNRRIVRITKDLRVTTLVDNFEGKRLNAPNDLVYRSDGTLFFTDPPYGLPHQDDDPAKELPFNGVFKLANGKARGDRQGPDAAERHRLFAGREDVVRVELGREAHASGCATTSPPVGTVSNGRVFFDTTAHDGRRPARRNEDRRARQHLGDRPERRLRVLARRQAPRHDQAARRSRPTAVGATTAGRCTSPPRPDCIESRRRSWDRRRCTRDLDLSRFSVVESIHDSAPRRSRRRSGEGAGDAASTFRRSSGPRRRSFEATST